MLNLFSHIWLFVAPWTVACQAPLSMEFSRQEYWNRLPFLPPGDLPHPWFEPMSPESPALAGGFFTTNGSWEALLGCIEVLLLWTSGQWEVIQDGFWPCLCSAVLKAFPMTEFGSLSLEHLGLIMAWHLGNLYIWHLSSRKPSACPQLLGIA